MDQAPGVDLRHFVYGCTSLLAPFAQKSTFSPLHCLFTFGKKIRGPCIDFIIPGLNSVSLT